MSDIHELYRTIAQQHIRLGQSYLALSDHLDYLRENPSHPLESEPELFTVSTAVHIPEMPVCSPSTMPPNNGITHYDSMPPFDHVSDTVTHAAEFAPDAEPAPSSEVRRSVVQASETPAVENAPPPPSRTRARNEYTAADWAHSRHFLSCMDKAPFNSWTAEQQNAKRDEFTATYKDAPPQNRWGKTFAKFCGVT